MVSHCRAWKKFLMDNDFGGNAACLGGTQVRGDTVKS